jgi:hypothetical protein
MVCPSLRTRPAGRGVVALLLGRAGTRSTVSINLAASTRYMRQIRANLHGVVHAYVCDLADPAHGLSARSRPEG